MFRKITRTVFIISLISLLNDFSSEMLYPVIPLYIKQIGYGTLFIGILEGLAECIAGLSKMYMGSLSDSFPRKTPFINIGYALSVLSRPLIGASSIASLIFLGRASDKIGKGIRTGARDTLLARECDTRNRAEVFGFHRSMDTAGAILGPLLAILYLQYYPGHYRSLFFLSVIPGIAAIVFTLLIKEKKTAEVQEKKIFSLRKHLRYFSTSPKIYKRFVWVMMIFAMASSSDMFLLLRAGETGMTEKYVLTMYILFNVVYAVFAFPIGKLADRVGKTKMLIIGMFIYLLTYVAFSLLQQSNYLAITFVLYGLFYAFTQSTTKALLVQTVPESETGSAIGAFEGISSIVLLLANIIAGWIWYQFGSVYMFGFTAVLVIIGLLLLLRIRSTLQRPSSIPLMT